MKRLSETEKLARRICWAGFVTPRDDTAASYWNGLSDETREKYIQEAKLVCFYAKQIGFDRFVLMVHNVMEEA
jgi:hypothetical protein